MHLIMHLTIKSSKTHKDLSSNKLKPNWGALQHTHRHPRMNNIQNLHLKLWASFCLFEGDTKTLICWFIRILGADGHWRPWKLWKTFQNWTPTLQPTLKNYTDNEHKCLFPRCKYTRWKSAASSFSSPTTCTFTGLLFCGGFLPTYRL